MAVATVWPQNGIELSQLDGEGALCLYQTDEIPAHSYIGFVAESRQPVDALKHAAMKAGARDNGAPGLRPQYGGRYYATFVPDPGGHNIEAVCHEAVA